MFSARRPYWFILNSNIQVKKYIFFGLDKMLLIIYPVKMIKYDAYFGFL